MKLVLGVVVLPYAHDTPTQKVSHAKPGKRNKPHKAKSFGSDKQVTTGDVAEWLEDEYHIMDTFVEQQMPVITMEFEKAISGAIVNLSLGAPPTAFPLESAMENLQQEFRTFLDENEVEAAGVAGVPTKAAQRGVNHRLKISRGSPRPSFIDTGLYQNSMKAWIEDD
jgi:hypothetical protein